MRRLLLLAALAACVPKQGGGGGSGGSRGIVSYGGGGGSYSSGTTSSAPSSHGSSADTQVYRTSATGSPIAASTNAADEQKSVGKGGLADNKLFRAGVITLGVSYVTTVVTGQIIQETMIGDFETAVGAKGTISRLWLPVIGPWSALIYNETDVRSNCSSMAGVPPWEYYNCDLMDVSSVLVFVGAAAQTTGFVLTLAGLLRPPKFRPKHDEKRLVVVPHGSAGGAGLVISGAF